MQKKSVRLPSHVKPLRYELRLKPDLASFTFEGEEIIHLDIQKPAKEIVLHAKEIKVASSRYEVAGKSWVAKKISYDEKSDTVIFSFNENLPKGKGELKLKFKGILNDQMRGFYRSKYMVDGKERHMATTQFEATDARRAFPCIDEPAAKAVFDVTLMVPKDLTAISNTIESQITEHEAGYKLVKFQPTPKMSTYLLAFIVGDFEYIEAKSKRDVLVRVFVTPGKKHQAKFALDCAIKTLDFYETYFDINYPLPVLDLIAIPDFAAGAMENWGAITYRETALLVDAEHTSAANKQWVALVIAHELAHQWFGNLVTMHWWTDLWLNEGFASYIEYLAVDELFPQWDIWTQFAYADLGVALKLDALENTHPIEVEVHHPDEIGEIFDEVSYSKGSSIIRMLAGYLGQENFRNGLRHYLKKHAYGNTRTMDLWKAFEKISKKPVSKMMQNWTGKGGYPVVKIVDEGSKMKLTQSRFFSSPVSKKKSNESTVWQIPVKIQNSVSHAERKAQTTLLGNKQTIIKKPSAKWTKINVGEEGFFRTDYPAQMLADLRTPIKDKQLPAIDRLGVVRDAFALSEAGDLPTAQAMELAQSYVNETDYTVWVELASGIDTLDLLLHEQAFFPEFKQYGKNLFKDIAEKLGWEPQKNEQHTTKLLRSLSHYHLGSFGDAATIQHAQKLFKRGQVPADVRGLVYGLVAEAGNTTEHQLFLKRYKAEQMHEEKNRMARGLASFRKPELLKKTLEFALSDQVRFQDTPSLVASVWMNPYGKKLAWEFVKKNWPVFLKRYGNGGYMLGRMIKAASYFNTEDLMKDFQKFYKTHKAPGASRAIHQSLERIQSNILWLKRDGKHIERYLKDNLGQ